MDPLYLLTQAQARTKLKISFIEQEVMALNLLLDKGSDELFSNSLKKHSEELEYLKKILVKIEEQIKKQIGEGNEN